MAIPCLVSSPLHAALSPRTATGVDKKGWGPGGGLLDPNLGIDYETDTESGSGQPVKVAHIQRERSPSNCPSFLEVVYIR